MKINVPLAVGASVVAAALAVLALWKPAPTPQELAAPAVDYVRNRQKARNEVEGRHFFVESSAIVRSEPDAMFVRLDIKRDTGQRIQEYHRLLLAGGEWRHERDLTADFKAYAEREARPICARLAQRLQETYQDKIDIPAENVRMRSTLHEIKDPEAGEPRVAGRVEVIFKDGGGEGSWVEEFSFENGAWTPQGGQLFSRGPRPR